MHPLPAYEKVIQRFAAFCRADERVLACFIGGSIAKGTADAHSDLDLYVITTEEGYPGFSQERQALLAHLGKPLFVEDFGQRDHVFFILSDGTEGEVGIGKASEFSHLHIGPYLVLHDKTGILSGFEFSELEPVTHDETLRRLLFWFWHDLSHFITAMGRGQLWWAYGQLEMLRGYCIKLARLQNDFFDASAADDPYFKLDNSIPLDWLTPLRVTFCPMEFNAMLYAASAILTFYRDLAQLLAQTHGIPYPSRLESVIVERFRDLGAAKR